MKVTGVGPTAGVTSSQVEDDDPALDEVASAPHLEVSESSSEQEAASGQGQDLQEGLARLFDFIAMKRKRQIKNPKLKQAIVAYERVHEDEQIPAGFYYDRKV